MSRMFHFTYLGTNNPNSSDAPLSNKQTAAIDIAKHTYCFNIIINKKFIFHDDRRLMEKSWDRIND